MGSAPAGATAATTKARLRAAPMVALSICAAPFRVATERVRKPRRARDGHYGEGGASARGEAWSTWICDVGVGAAESTQSRGDITRGAKRYSDVFTWYWTPAPK